MRSDFRKVQLAIARAARALGGDVRLSALAREASLSPFHLHRVFSAVTNETPKQYSLRLRLGRAAGLLLTSQDSVLRIALECGFESHEGFARAFKRHFGLSPSAYRARGFATATTEEQKKIHLDVVDRVGPCVRLFHLREERKGARNSMSYSVTKKEVSPQAVLLERRRVAHAEIGATIGDVVGRIFHHAQGAGLALTGHPFTRYLDVGPGHMTIEPGMRVSGVDPSAWAADPEPADAAEGVRRDVLPGGTVASTVHFGPYERLNEAYAAIESWMKAEGLSPAGAPWESYLNDPSEHPNPQDWQTEVSWPVK